MIKRKFQFKGNRLLLVLTPLIFRLLKALIRAGSPLPKTPVAQVSVLYVYREWGEDTAVILATKDSLGRFLGTSPLDCLCLKTMDSIVAITKTQIGKRSYTHLVLDWRAMVASAFWYQIPGLLADCRRLANTCYENNISVLCQSTDFYDPADRIVSSLLTSNGGQVISLACLPNLRFFPHKRVIGPAPITLPKQATAAPAPDAPREIPVFFGGSLYQPRKSFFDSLARELELRRIGFVYSRKSDVKAYEDYLNILSRSKIVVLTTVVSLDRRLRQLQGKAIEATGMGALLIAQQCDSLDAFFEPNIDYVPFDGLDQVDHVANLIEQFLSDNGIRSAIAANAQRKILTYTDSGGVWSRLDPPIFQKQLEISEMKEK